MKKQLAKGVVFTLFVFYLLLVIYIVFFARRRASLQFVSAGDLINLIPVKNTINEFLQIRPTQPKEVFNFYSNLIGNIFLFFPLPFFLSYMYKVKSYKQVLLVALLASVIIELTQYLFKVGVADIDDVLLNLIGALIGYWSLQCFLHFFSSTNNKYSSPF